MKKKSSMNKKVLGGLVAQSDRPKPTINLYGEDARRLFNKKPGEKVSAKITGVVQSVGMREWNNNEPEAQIKITDFSCKDK